jgi:hypothetical protein
MRRHLAILLLALTLPLSAAETGHVDDMKAGLALFTKTIRPALEANCLKCHGGEKVRSGLNVASRELLLKGGDNGPAVDLENPSESLLLLLISHAEEPEMPPKKPKLPATLIAEFSRWVELGAPYDKPLLENIGAVTELVVTDSDREFWSFAPLATVTTPELADPWIKTDIDRFVRASQKKLGLTPNPSADKRTLARRAFLDLIGMPPTPEQMQAFLEDRSPEAYSKLLDSLLGSPEYGPRWARHWIDVARFGESYGFEQNYDRNSAYHYRDFLIQAFNQDMPWDQFVSWQLAGDELAPEEPLAMMATGFLAGGVFPTQLTEAEFESARYDELDDMLGTTGLAFLGLSVGCARCHDHKYDPIPMKDYYAMAATFATAIRSEADVEFDSGEHDAKVASWQDKHEELKRDLETYRKSRLAPAFAAWLQQPTDLDAVAAGSWQVLEPRSAKSENGATLTRQPDASWLASGTNPRDDAYTIVAQALAGTVALRVEALTHESFTRKGPGRAGNGNIGLSDIAVTASNNEESVPVVLIDARATHEQNNANLSVKSAIDGDKASTGWAVDGGGIGKDQAAVFVFDKPLAQDAELSIHMVFKLNTQHNFGRFRLAASANAAADFELGKGAPAELSSGAVALKAGETLTDAQRAALLDWFSGRDREWQTRHGSLQEHLAAKPARKTQKVMICSEGVPKLNHHANGRGYPHFYENVHFLTRGDPKQKGEVMKQKFLTVLTAPAQAVTHWQLPAQGKKSFRRASLAKWMTDAENGAGRLLARVIVNRLWHYHFGEGLVTTPNDFGFQGDRPVLPELLDWLAADLIENGWRLKRLHKLIMSSAVYRQSTAHDAERARLDIDNRYFWRFAPRRLEAEAIRDSQLSVSGLLDPRLYGPGTLDENMRRRSIYFTIKRAKPPNSMIVFDWPEHLVSIGKRSQTTIAPQALHFMNSPQARKYAAGLLARVGEGTLAARTQRIYELALNRPPRDSELRAITAFVETHRDYYPKNGEHQALLDFCQAILGSNEFLYIQ